MAKKRAGKSRTKWARGERPAIGLLMHGLESFGQPVWRGVADAARERDVSLLCVVGGVPGVGAGGRPARADVLYDLLGSERLDGVVVTGIVGYRMDAVARFHPLPVVGTVLGRVLEGIPSIVTDGGAGMRDAVAHLIEVHGCRRIAYVRGPVGSKDGDERYEVYSRVLAEHGIDLDPDLVVVGSHQRRSGQAAARVLLDERRPEFDALVGGNDQMALGALGVLRARGVRVPQDVAVVGFDDIGESALVTPPLTTVRFPRYEAGRRAIELMLALLEGEDVPAEVPLPAPLVIRRSCGCVGAAVTEAAVGEAEIEAAGFGTAFACRRERIVASVAEAAGAPGEGRAERLVDAFAGGVGGGGPAHAFVLAAQEGVERAATGAEAAAWQDALSALRRGVLPCLGDEAVRARAEDLLQQARVVVGEEARRAEGRAAVQAQARAEMLREVGASLIRTFDVGELMDVLAGGLPQLGIAGAYLALYEDAEHPLGESRLMLAYNERGRTEMGDGRVFPSCDLLPEGMPGEERRFSLVMEALHFGEHQLGFALFEEGAGEGSVYDALGGQISSALEGALLLRERARAERALEKAYAEVERQVEERTAELRREVEERERVQEESVRLQQEVIEAQRRAIQELSTPIIPVAERVLVMPLIGSVDSLRARDITRRLLTGIREHRARVVILDVTGVPMIDSGIASHLNRTIQAARLKGARTIVTGISDAVAETIVDLGIDWSEVETLADLQTGLRLVMTTS